MAEVAAPASGKQAFYTQLSLGFNYFIASNLQG